MKPYPFSAIVGHDQLRLALLLCAVRPEIGGALIRGEKGTAKSTAVRGLAALLSAATGEGGLVEMPLGATEDRVIGSLDLQRVLRDGEHAFSPGLLARAHGGVLYVDEVNLLHDHLVDVLLDAAAMGRVHIERDGISHSHEARFVLIGTMNPEEGELRPQLLDRFGLTVDVRASRDVDVRVEVIRQRMAYEADPDGFADRYADADAELARRIAAARELVADVVLPDNELRRIAALCAAFDVDGMRADLVVARTAAAHAAWRGSTAVEERDVRVAAELALPHRRRRDPFDDPGIDRDQLEQALALGAPPACGGAGGDHEPDPDPPGGGGQSANDDAPQPHSPTSAKPQPPRPSAPPTKTFRARALRVPGVGEGAPGRRSRARNATGSVVAAAEGSADAATGARGLHLFATLLSAAGRAGAGPLRPGPDDVRLAVHEGREGNLVIFVVDASGSMAARDRMAAVGGATLSLLRDAYQRRDKVAVITFRQDAARLLLPPTSSAHIAGRRLARFDTGGKTPLAEGLLAARELIVREKARDRTRRPLVVVLTDGRATGGADPLGRSRIAAARLVAEGAAAVVVDCETSYVRLGLAAQLARRLGAPTVRLEQLHADHLVRAVRTAAWRRAAMPQGSPSRVPDDGLTTRARRNTPVLAVHTGDGKGKSTAAFGMALRAWNAGLDVAVFQFVKSAKWKVGEEAAFADLGRLHDEHGIGGAVEWHKMGAGWSWARKAGSEVDHAAAAADGWAEIARRLAAQRHDFYVLDEFTYPLTWGWVDVDEVVEALTARPGHQHVVITGRGAPQRLIGAADLVTEMTKVKHPMDAGRKGQKGVEW